MILKNGLIIKILFVGEELEDKNIKVMGRKFYGFNNRFRTTKNTEAIVFENGGFVGYLNPYYRSAYNIPKRRK